jgi:hypothetical protein
MVLDVGWIPPVALYAFLVTAHQAMRGIHTGAWACDWPGCETPEAVEDPVEFWGFGHLGTGKHAEIIDNRLQGFRPGRRRQAQARPWLPPPFSGFEELLYCCLLLSVPV